MRHNFTKGRVDEFTCPPEKRQAFLWDQGVPGLGIRATAGAKTYIFQSRLNGKTIRHSIGAVMDWDIDEARAEARRLARLIDQGIHPQHDKKNKEEAAKEKFDKQEAASVSLETLWQRYIDTRMSEWSPSHLRDHLAAMQKPGQPRKRSKKKTTAGSLYTLRNETLLTLNPDLIIHWMESERKKRPAVAARAYRLLRSCLAWVNEQPEFKGLIKPEEIFNGSVRRIVPRMKAKEGDVLQKEQLSAWFKEVCKLTNPQITCYLQALLLTGARRNELTGMMWADIDFTWHTIQIRDKVEGERIIPLPPYLAQTINSLPRKNRFVFYSRTSKSGHITEPRIAHNRAIKAAGLPHISLHGLRRSFGTLAEWVECPAGVIAQIQGHKPSAIAEKHYRRRPVDLLRVWHTKIEKFILEQAEIEQPSIQEGKTNLKIVG